MVLSAFLLGCSNDGDASENETIAPGAEVSAEEIDVTGSYNVQLAAATGCDEESFWLEDWAKGPMKIDETDGGVLVFDFFEDLAFEGTVDGSRNYSFLGDAEFSIELSEDTGSETVTRMARLGVENRGRFSLNGSCWEMDGDFSVVVDEDDNGLEFDDCTITGPMRATQIRGENCNGLQ